MARSLIAQLCHEHEDARGKLNQLFESCGDGKKQPTMQDLLSTLHAIIDTFDGVKVVLDILDESQTRKELLSWIEEFVTSSCKDIHLIITSRREEDIESLLIRWMRVDKFVPIQHGTVNEDILAYVRKRVRTDEGLRRWQSRLEVQKEIETKLSE
jgi:hypothetical protein